MYPSKDQVEEALISQNDDRIMAVLVKISADDKLCDLCVKTHSANYTIEHMMKYKLKHFEQEEKKELRA